MATRTARPTVYPLTDGKPVAESDIHRRVLLTTVARLEERYRDDPDVYASGNMLVYYVEGDATKVLSPDGFVVFGVEKRDREIYQTWLDGEFPAVVFEFTSKSTRREDLTKKFRIYRDDWRVREYFLFDPRDEYLDPPLQGFRRGRGGFRPIPLSADGTLTSTVLGITMGRDGYDLRLRDTVTGAAVLTASEREAVEATRQATEATRQATEATRQATEATRRADVETAARQAAEAELARLRAELAALKKGK